MVDNGCMGITYQIFLKKKKVELGQGMKENVIFTVQRGKPWTFEISREYFICVMTNHSKDH